MKWTNFNIKLAGDDITHLFAEFQLEQAISNHHFFTLRLPSDDRLALFKNTLKTSSEKWLGENVEVDGYFKGVITSIGLSRAKTGSSEFVIRGQSTSILADDALVYKSYGKKPLNKIIDEAFTNYAGKIDIESNPGYTKELKYCVQYAESNFDFINRLAARYGEWFYYDGQKLIFGKLPASDPIRLDFASDLSYFDISLNAVPVNFKIVAYDYKNPNSPPTKSSEYSDLQNPFAKVALNKSKGEIFGDKIDLPIQISMDDADLEQIKTLKQNLNIARLTVLSGTSTNFSLGVGKIIEIVDSRQGLLASGLENYGKYVITRLQHSVSTHGDDYTNSFDAIPADVVVPLSQISPDPPLCQPQFGEVKENNDPKKLGRVRVQFSWQKSLKGEDRMTPWIRVSSPMASGDKGFYMVPEKGDQVIVGFEQSHPEKPFVLVPGMYHGEAKPEYFDSNNYKKAIKTKGGNLILMVDEDKKQSMALSSPVDFSGTATDGKMDFTAKKTITIKSEVEEIRIEAPKKIILQADAIEINGAKSVKINGQTIDIVADMSLEEKALTVKIEGTASTDVKGTGMLNLESSGITSVTGSMLKLN